MNHASIFVLPLASWPDSQCLCACIVIVLHTPCQFPTPTQLAKLISHDVFDLLAKYGKDTIYLLWHPLWRTTEIGNNSLDLGDVNCDPYHYWHTSRTNSATRSAPLPTS